MNVHNTDAKMEMSKKDTFDKSRFDHLTQHPKKRGQRDTIEKPQLFSIKLVDVFLKLHLDGFSTNAQWPHNTERYIRRGNVRQPKARQGHFPDSQKPDKVIFLTSQNQTRSFSRQPKTRQGHFPDSQKARPSHFAA